MKEVKAIEKIIGDTLPSEIYLGSEALEEVLKQIEEEELDDAGEYSEEEEEKVKERLKALGYLD